MSFFVLTAVGLPISSLFWNNFVLISEIFRESFGIGLWVMAALLLVAPLFVFALNRHYKIPNGVSERAGFAMMFFLLLLAVLVNGNYGIID